MGGECKQRKKKKKPETFFNDLKKKEVNSNYINGFKHVFGECRQNKNDCF